MCVRRVCVGRIRRNLCTERAGWLANPPFTEHTSFDKRGESKIRSIPPPTLVWYITHSLSLSMSLSLCLYPLYHLPSYFCLLSVFSQRRADVWLSRLNGPDFYSVQSQFRWFFLFYLFETRGDSRSLCLISIYIMIGLSSAGSESM